MNVISKADLSRHDQKLELILRTSARIFAEKSYHSTSMRDISRATGVSLAGLYHYCKSKEELLFLIQDHCFGRVLERLNKRLATETDPVQKLRVLIENHLAFFAANMAEMKVLSHEADSLSGELHVRVSGKKDKYTRTARRILGEIRQNRPNDKAIDLTVATYSLFGMINWIYNWYNPRGKIDVNDLVDNLIELFLSGFLGHADSNGGKQRKPTRPEPADIWLGARRKSAVLLLLLTLLCSYRPFIAHAQQQTQPSGAKTNPTPPPAVDPGKTELLPEPAKTPRKMCYGSGVYGGNINYEPVPEEPRLGIEAKGYPKSINPKPAPKGMLTVFNVTFKEVKYTVYVGDKKLIQRISTSDPRFKTVEGLAVGDQAEKAIAASKKPPINNANCFYSVILSSGWEAWFGAESVAADGSLAPNSKVTGFAMSARMKD